MKTFMNSYLFSSFFSPFLFYLVLWLYCHKAACKRMQHCWPTTPNIVRCYMLRPFAHPVACCWMLLRKVWNWSNSSANNSQHFFCSVIAEAWRNNVGCVCTALPTLFCWELLHPFAHSLTTNILNLERQGRAFIASYSNILKYLCCI